MKIAPGICEGCNSLIEYGRGKYDRENNVRCAVMSLSQRGEIRADAFGGVQPEVYATLDIPEHCDRAQDHENANRLREL